jgi:hypothetical protein
LSAPHEPGGPRDSLVRAQFAPDFRRSDPADPARLMLVLDNHDTVTRLVRVELAGPLARYTRPRRHPRLELPPRRQQEIALEVRPEDTRPEGDHAYDLHAVVIDEKTEQVVFTCTARIGVEPAPAIATRPAGATPSVVQGEVPVQLRVHVRNNGNIPLRVDAQRVTLKYWVRDDDRRREEVMYAARRAIRNEQSEPRTPERLRPRQTHDFDVIVTAPRYLVGTRARRWWVPIGVRAEETDAECEFVDFVQRPQWELEERMVWLGVAVVAALLVLIVFMVLLAT